MPEVTIISDTITNRLEYTCKVIFNVILCCNYRIVKTSDAVSIDSFGINYSDSEINNSLQIVPSGLLAQESIGDLNFDAGEFENLVTLFSQKRGDIPFDLFSASFYILSRYEEYLPFEPDKYGRFTAKEGIAYKNGFHELPIVELWAKLLADKLGVPVPKGSGNSILTIDIDDAWRYKNKGFVRNFGGLIKSFLRLNIKTAFERVKVNLGDIKDPFDTYDYLIGFSSSKKIPLHFFVLMGNSRKEDTAYNPASRLFKGLINRLGKVATLGIHPSFASSKNSLELDAEWSNLNKILGDMVNESRQHYLMLHVPKTYQKLIELKIQNDFSMGWSDLPGFRAGISRPFPFFDLEKNIELPLTIHPFVTMDRTLKDYMGLTIEESVKEIRKLKKTVDSVGGQWCMIWHNDSVSDYDEWKGWRKVFESQFND